MWPRDTNKFVGFSYTKAQAKGIEMKEYGGVQVALER